MRTFVISDIHGNNEAFRKALKRVKLKKSDLLILLGDCIDRGFDSKGVLDTIMLLIDHGFNLVCLKGNHEQMFLDAASDTNKLPKWLLNGGGETLSSFLTASIDKIPQRYINLIHSFKNYHLKDNFIFVHAALNMLADMPFEDTETMLWERNQKSVLNLNWLGERVVIHGHNPTKKSDIITAVINDNIICIDNGVFLKKEGFGSICVLELENLNIEFIN